MEKGGGRFWEVKRERWWVAPFVGFTEGTCDEVRKTCDILTHDLIAKKAIESGD